MRRIYLDNAATTKPDPEVIQVMNDVQEKHWGNASSIYNEGQDAKAILEDSRRKFAELIGADAEEIIFTSGGTEADNLAIKGVVDAFYKNNQDTRYNNQIPNTQTAKKLTPNKLIPHVITSAFEHHAVLDTVKELEKSGIIEATYVKPNAKGLIEVSDIEAAIKDNTILVSIMYVNNEIGTVQPIREIAQAISRNNELRIKNNGSKHNSSFMLHNSRIYFHTDAVQAVEYFDMDVKNLEIDMMSIAAHKFHGPKGVGALYVRKGTPLIHQNVGGGQERKRRAGTENVAGIVGMVKALELATAECHPELDSGSTQIDSCFRRNDKIIGIQNLRDKLIDGILSNIPDTRLNGDKEKRSPANANISFMNAEGESIVLMLDLAGVSVSSGSACTSGSLDPSHVLLAIGLKHEEAHGSVRFTLGRDTTEEEIDKVLELLPPIIERLRKMSPL